jgi:hypothetical protein
MKIIYKNSLLEHILNINKCNPIEYVTLSFKDFEDVLEDIKNIGHTPNEIKMKEDHFTFAGIAFLRSFHEEDFGV